MAKFQGDRCFSSLLFPHSPITHFTICVLFVSILCLIFQSYTFMSRIFNLPHERAFQRILMHFIFVITCGTGNGESPEQLGYRQKHHTTKPTSYTLWPIWYRPACLPGHNHLMCCKYLAVCCVQYAECLLFVFRLNNIRCSRTLQCLIYKDKKHCEPEKRHLFIFAITWSSVNQF